MLVEREGLLCLLQLLLYCLYLPIQACPLPSLLVHIELRQLVGERGVLCAQCDEIRLLFLFFFLFFRQYRRAGR